MSLNLSSNPTMRLQKKEPKKHNAQDEGGLQKGESMCWQL